jgi:hypothetical protein
MEDFYTTLEVVKQCLYENPPEGRKRKSISSEFCEHNLSKGFFRVSESFMEDNLFMVRKVFHPSSVNTTCPKVFSEFQKVLWKTTCSRNKS